MTSSHLTILTGASRGMGHAMAAQLIAAGHDLLCISRKTNDALSALAVAQGVACEQWPHDLARADSAAAKLETWLAGRDGAALGSVTLINNAGLLPRIAPLGDIPAQDLVDALRVDLEAPMLLTSVFLRATRTWTIDKRVLNISSGAGRRAIAGWSAYCAAKAGLDHFTRVTALDEPHRPNPARLVSLAPGVIDTAMQEQLRASDPAGFPDKPKVEELKSTGQLSTPEAAAKRVLAFLARADFGIEPVADARDA